MARHAIINTDGIIVNIVEWASPQDEWLPPRGHYVVEIGDASFAIDDTYDFVTRTFTVNPNRLSQPDVGV